MKTVMISKNLHISIRVSLLLIYMRSSSTYSLLNASKSFMINEIRQKEISVSITKVQSAFSQITISRPMFKTMCALEQSSGRKVIRCDIKHERLGPCVKDGLSIGDHDGLVGTQ